MTDLVLAELNTARTALAKADTIQKTKNVLDVAVAAETYAKRQKLGEEAISFATSIKVEALRQLGNMLKDTPRNKGSRLVGGSSKYSGGSDVEPPDEVPTLSEMGLDKKTSKLAQDIASLPEEQYEKVRQGVASLSKAQKKVRELRSVERRAELVEIAKTVSPSDRYDVFVGDISNVELEPNSIDAIITDPPYPKDCLPLWRELGKFAKRHLKVGGVLLAMTGDLYLPEIINMLGENLTYQWVLACVLPGQHSEVFAAWVNNQMWKPVLVYRNGGELVNIGSDLFENGTRDKGFHEWGQGIDGYLWQVEHFTKPNDIICDPFLGGGTTAVASIKSHRRFIGFDIEEENVLITKSRLHALI